VQFPIASHGRCAKGLQDLEPSDIKHPGTTMPNLSTHTSIRPYTATDLDACLSVFRSNVPGWFDESELPEYASFLASGPSDGTYMVVESAGTIAACGGSAVHDGVGRLCWGMVERSKHRSSLGSTLLVHRLEILFGPPATVLQVGIDTSPQSAGFFARFGFKTQQVTADGLAHGMDCVAMTLRRDDWLNLPPSVLPPHKRLR
jgi:hypothetical protein